MRVVEVSPQALANAREQGIFGDAETRLMRMAKRSAPVTSEYGNRRFHDFVMYIVDGVMLDITRVDFTESVA